MADKFFKQEYYLNILEKRVKGLKDGYRQNIAIIGDESIGKTSLVLHFLNYFNDNSIIPVYLDLNPCSLEYLSKRFIGALLYNFLRNSDIALREDLEFLINKSEKYIPETIKKIKTMLSSQRRKHKISAFSELLTLPELIHQETKKRCLIIFDEFHHLETMGIKNLYPTWRKALLLQKNTMYIIISSAKFKTKIILSESLSLLFGNFQVMEVEPFDLKTNEEFLEKKLGQISLDKSLKNFLIHFTGGHPFYLSAITDALIKSQPLGPSDNILTYSNFTDILEELLFEESGLINQRLSNYLKRISQARCICDYTSVLYLIASGHNRVRDIAHILHKQKKDVLQKITYLLETDTLSRNGDFFYLNDRVFCFWLKFVHKVKVEALNFNIEEKRNLFKNKIDGAIKDFIMNSQKPLSQRLTELLRLFENEAVCLDRKRIRLTPFREIKSLGLNCRNLKDALLARSTNSLWIVALKDDLITEEDIAEFTKECKKYRHRIQKKIVITRDGIDTNARLKALEEKILTWNLNNLNQLLDLFNRPRVVI